MAYKLYFYRIRTFFCRAACRSLSVGRGLGPAGVPPASMRTPAFLYSLLPFPTRYRFPSVILSDPVGGVEGSTHHRSCVDSSTSYLRYSAQNDTQKEQAFPIHLSS